MSETYLLCSEAKIELRPANCLKNISSNALRINQKSEMLRRTNCSYYQNIRRSSLRRLQENMSADTGTNIDIIIATIIIVIIIIVIIIITMIIITTHVVIALRSKYENQ